MLGDLGSSDVLAPALAEVARGAARTGRRLESLRRIARLNVVLSDDVNAARGAVAPWVLAYLWHAYPDWSLILDYSPDWDSRLAPLKAFIAERGARPRNVGEREQVLRFAGLLPEGLLRRYALAGRPEDILAQLQEVAGTGVDEVAIFPTPLPGQDIEAVLHSFIERVLPNAPG
jgi:alkanesulfonate monooxygenase SsuD/methylene tetrahydromethanopterin reductase-like flavin-dependent oxidoreductase (luciferase family)